MENDAKQSDELVGDTSSGTSDEQANRDESTAPKHDERAELSERADVLIERYLQTPQAVATLLSKQYELGVSAINTMLILDQFPEASKVKKYDEWSQEHLPEEKRTSIRHVKTGMTGLKVFEACGEYTRKDGNTGTRYKVGYVFDLSQTYGTPIEQKEQTYPSIRELVKAFCSKTRLPIRPSSEVDADTIALFQDDAILTARNVKDGGMLLAKIAGAYVAATCGQQGDHARFIGDCSACLICKAFGIDTPTPKQIAGSIKSLEVSKKRELLSEIHKQAKTNTDRMRNNLALQKQKAWQR